MSAQIQKTSTPLWRPSAERVAKANITRYLAWLKEHRGLTFKDYESLWRWSIDELETFWGTIWQFFGVISHSPYKQVLDKRTMPGAKWFEGATLNYAEHAVHVGKGHPGGRERRQRLFRLVVLAGGVVVAPAL